MITKIKNSIVENIKFDFNKFKKIYHSEYTGYTSIVLYLGMCAALLYYSLMFLPLPFLFIFDALLDKKNSNQKFVKVYNWVSWSLFAYILIYSCILVFIIEK